jgi:hypothetical protein
MEKKDQVEEVAEGAVPVQDPPAEQPVTVDPNQAVETDAYVPTYNVRPELKQAVLKAIGKYPFNQIATIMNAINATVMDHNTLTQIINVLGNFPYQDVSGLLGNINDYVEQVIGD